MSKQKGLGKPIEVPEEWQVTRLEDHIEEIGDGGTPKSSNEAYYGGDINWAVVKDVEFEIEDTERHLTQEGLKNSSAKLWPKGSVIVTTGATIGKVGIAKKSTSTKQGITGIIPENNLDSYFLAYYIQSKKKTLNRFAQGGTFEEIRPYTTRKLKLPVPPLEEQERISEILSTVDEAIQQTDEIIESSRELKKGLMQDLLTKGIGHDEFKEVKIGPKYYQIPENWRAVRLEEIADVSSGGTPRRKNEDYWDGGTIPWMKSGEMTNGKIREIEETITEEGLENSSAKIFEEGTVVMALYGKGTVSRTGILGQDAAVNQAIAGMEPLDDAFEPRYLQMVLNFMRNIILNWAINPSSDTGRTNIYLGALRKLRVPLPPLEEQEEISDKISSINEKIRQEEEYMEKLEELKKGLMQDLLTGEIRVKTTNGGEN